MNTHHLDFLGDDPDGDRRDHQRRTPHPPGRFLESGGIEYPDRVGTPHRISTLIFLALLGLVLSGCGSAGERRSDAETAATGFERLLRADDPTGLCTALAPETRSELEESEKASCEKAISSQEIPQGGTTHRVDVYGRQARVVLDADTLFLSRFPDGWKLVAAGCTPRPGRPYQCTLQGG
jgi:hypothetical protein